jgi:hypothetical protein
MWPVMARNASQPKLLFLYSEASSQLAFYSFNSPIELGLKLWVIHNWNWKLAICIAFEAEILVVQIETQVAATSLTYIDLNWKIRLGFYSLTFCFVSVGCDYFDALVTRSCVCDKHIQPVCCTRGVTYTWLGHTFLETPLHPSISYKLNTSCIIEFNILNSNHLNVQHVRYQTRLRDIGLRARNSDWHIMCVYRNALLHGFNSKLLPRCWSYPCWVASTRRENTGFFSVLALQLRKNSFIGLIAGICIW